MEADVAMPRIDEHSLREIFARAEKHGADLALDYRDALAELAAEKCKRLTCDGAGMPSDLCHGCEACLRRELEPLRAREAYRVHCAEGACDCLFNRAPWPACAEGIRLAEAIK